MKDYRKVIAITKEDKHMVDHATKAQLMSWHNLGYNGHPEFWFYVHRVLCKKYPSTDPKYFFDTSKV